jgi:ATP-binding cassette subfamily C protein
VGVAVFSAAMNLLMLTGPLFMLQVYDRVLASRSSATLLILTAIVVFLFVVMGVLDHVRGRVLARIGAGFQAGLDARVFAAVLRQAEYPQLRERPPAGMRDLSAIQQALGSAGTGALFDLPWTPVFVTVLFVFHPWMGWFAIAACLVILILALLNQQRTARPQAEAARLTMEAEMRGEVTRKGIESVLGLGMAPAMTGQWHGARDAALRATVAAADAGGSWSAATKAFRLLVQSAILALGAWLALQGEVTAGAMIAGSILLGRALAPIEQIVGFWPQTQRGLRAWRDLNALLVKVPVPVTPMALPRPVARLEVKDLATVPPGESVPTLQGLTFSAAGGDAIAVIGPSAAGKSSLARALVGLWPPARGEVRLGGADLHQYGRDTRGRLFGFLPQEVVLFPGSIAQNIARFSPDPDPAGVVAAAQEAAAHEMILALPQGYDTLVTEGGGRLSGGQRQRVALARAFYGDPVVLVLDEPNASLDDPGVQALNRAIANARAAGRIAIVMSHRPSALAECNLVLFLDGGRMRAFGPRDEVLKKILQPGANAVPAARPAEARP